jgi:hypothetical protein
MAAGVGAVMGWLPEWWLNSFCQVFQGIEQAPKVFYELMRGHLRTNACLSWPKKRIFFSSSALSMGISARGSP